MPEIIRREGHDPHRYTISRRGKKLPLSTSGVNSSNLTSANSGNTPQSNGYLTMGPEGLKMAAGNARWDESITMYRGDMESADDDQREDESDDSEEISSNEEPRTPLSW